MLWCWCCPVLKGPFTYRVLDSTVSILDSKKGRPEADFPYEDYPRPFPQGSALLHPISTRAQALIARLNAGHSSYSKRELKASTPVHQVGGIPYLLQGTDYQSDWADELRCPTCGHSMALFASVGNRCFDPRGLCGNDFVQVLFHVCFDDGVVTAIQQCD